MLHTCSALALCSHRQGPDNFVVVAVRVCETQYSEITQNSFNTARTDNV